MRLSQHFPTLQREVKKNWTEFGIKEIFYDSLYRYRLINCSAMVIQIAKCSSPIHSIFYFFHLNPFHATGLFLFPLKTTKKQVF